MSDPGKLLSSYLESIRGDRGVRQSKLASEAEISDSYVSQVLAGTTVPSDERLAAFTRALGIEDQLPQVLMRAGHDRVASGPKGEGIRQAYLNLIESLVSDASRSGEPVPARTLEYFPRAFDPLVIVTGDKREDPPKTPGDVGALSASPLDDRYLRRIPLPASTEKISDKVFITAEEDYLRKTFGHRNLFVIGSPASNHLARKINQHALFPFAFDRKTVAEIEQIITDGIDETKKHGVSGLTTHRDRKMKDLKFIMHEFKQGGIFDPLPEARKLRARSLRDDVDFATITLAKHPYADSDEFVAIMAAGFHLPGTVCAVRLLSKPLQFESHPFGGVVKVKMSEAAWYERIEKARTQWDTQDYKTAEIISALRQVPKESDWPMSGREARELIGLVSNLAGLPAE